ncbi:MAG: hypothetical protein DRG24_04205, partial [Epsilonproteobacteria bacterium]
MAYWHVRAKLDRSYLNDFLDENRWELLSPKHKDSEVFRETINSIQTGEILFLADENQKISHYSRCTNNLLNGKDIEVDLWKDLSNPVQALTSGAYIKT